MNRQILIMGVSGCGKSTIGKLLASQLDLAFFDADDFHSKANKDKMKQGIPLNDDDRADWLKSIAVAISQEQQKGFVLACSALKEKYRAQIASKLTKPLCIFHLSGNKEVIASRMQKRNHFMPASLLNNQFEILECSDDMHDIDISLTEKEIINQIINQLAIEKF
jgi:carbohydrate kinase (thermoresistant glucokinase family)